jgi:hypothetical protein
VGAAGNSFPAIAAALIMEGSTGHRPALTLAALAISRHRCASRDVQQRPRRSSLHPAPAGYYASGAGNVAASLCLAGTFSSAGAAAGTPLPTGSYVSDRVAARSFVPTVNGLISLLTRS